MSPRRPVLGLVVVALLLTACGGRSSGAATSTTVEGSPTIRPELAGADDTVLVIGDSLTVGARTMGGLDGRLRAVGFDDVQVIAEEGRDATWGLEQIEALPAVPPLVVVELGTNRSANPAGFPEVVDAIIAALRARGAVEIAWVTPVFATDDRYQEKADIIESAAGIDLVADWAAVVRDDPAIMSSDGLHPTEPGYGQLAEFLAEAAADLAGP